MSSSAYSKRFELPWTASEKQRLWKLKTTGDTKDLSWNAFHKLKHFPDRSNSAVQVQWSRLRTERGLPRQRRARGSLDSTVPEKRSAAHLENVTEPARFPKALENADDNRVIGSGAGISSDGEFTENEGATSDDSVRYQNHSQATDETQRLSNPGSDSQNTAAVHSTLFSATISGPTPTTSEQPFSLSFTPLNITPIVQQTDMRDIHSNFLQAPVTGSKQTPGFSDSDERNLLGCSDISSRENPHSHRTGRPGVSTHPDPPSSTGSTAVEQAQLPHPPGFSRAVEELATQADHSSPTLGPCHKSSGLEKASEELVSHVRTFTEDVEHRINDLISGWSLEQKELSLLRNVHEKVTLERDELKEKLIAEIREKEGYKKEVEDLKAELKQMKEEMRRVEEDKKKITGVYKTLEELVGFAKD
ncbi:hypothetical protein BDW72DRAFT_177878 [Aspergillus terricola var. indicus]